MKILIIGTWQKQRAEASRKEAEQIGKILAERKHKILSGGGPGISAIVVSSYKKYKGKEYTCYTPSEEYMEKVGETIGPKPDKHYKTKHDYPTRNIQLVKKCDAVIALQGGLGTITEIIHGIKDYNKKVAVIDKGELAKIIRKIPELKEKVFLTKKPEEAIKYLETNFNDN